MTLQLQASQHTPSILYFLWDLMNRPWSRANTYLWFATLQEASTACITTQQTNPARDLDANLMSEDEGDSLCQNVLIMYDLTMTPTEPNWCACHAHSRKQRTFYQLRGTSRQLLASSISFEHARAWARAERVETTSACLQVLVVHSTVQRSWESLARWRTALCNKPVHISTRVHVEEKHTEPHVAAWCSCMHI